MGKQMMKIIEKIPNIVIIAMLILSCLFSGSVQARTEMPANLIEIKDNTINEIMLKAGGEIELKAIYNGAKERVELNWTPVEGASGYKIYQQQEGKAEEYIATVQTTSANISKATACDEAAPNMPQVTTTDILDEDGNKIGMNLNISKSTDNGTTYRHYIEASSSMVHNGDLVIACDFGSNNNGFVKAAVEKLQEIAYDAIINKGLRVGIVLNGGDKSTRSYPLTNDYEEIKQYIATIKNQGKIKHSDVDQGIPVAVNMLNQGNSKNKAILMIQDYDDKRSESYLLNTIKPQAKDIKFYIIATHKNGHDIYWWEKNFGAVIMQTTNSELVCEYFKTMVKEISDEFQIKSNIASTTITSGLQGYQYVINDSRTHEFSKNHPVVSYEELPTELDGSKGLVQVLHIRAIDNEGNASETNHIILEVDPMIKLSTTYEYGMNYVPLEWNINDQRKGYIYRLWQKDEKETKFIQIPSSNSIQTIAKQETITTKYTTPGNWTFKVPEGVTSVKVTVAGAGGGSGGNVRYKRDARK